MNDLKRFNAEAAQSFADTAKKKYDDKITRMANKYIRVIDSKYESKIKKAVSKDPSIRSVDIKLPKYNRPIKLKDGILVEKEINEHLRERGFRVELHLPYHCNCIFNGICFDKKIYASLSW